MAHCRRKLSKLDLSIVPIRLQLARRYSDRSPLRALSRNIVAKSQPVTKTPLTWVTGWRGSDRSWRAYPVGFRSAARWRYLDVEVTAGTLTVARRARNNHRSDNSCHAAHAVGVVLTEKYSSSHPPDPDGHFIQHAIKGCLITPTKTRYSSCLHPRMRLTRLRMCMTWLALLASLTASQAL